MRFTPLSVLILLAAPVAAQVNSTGTFSNPVVPGNTGGNFWDNLSNDGASCNFGFFVVGGYTSGCQDAAGTFGNANFHSGVVSYLGNGTAGADFTFDGSYGYSVFLAGMATATVLNSGVYNTLGIYRYNGSSYTSFTPLWSATAGFAVNPAVGSSFYIAPGDDWGFYITNGAYRFTGCDGSANDVCSNLADLGGFYNFALFRSDATGTYGHNWYIVGAEDGRIDNGVADADYNDFMMGVTQTPEPASMALVATGLLAMAGAGVIRRRRQA